MRIRQRGRGVVSYENPFPEKKMIDEKLQQTQANVEHTQATIENITDAVHQIDESITRMEERQRKRRITRIVALYFVAIGMIYVSMIRLVEIESVVVRVTLTGALGLAAVIATFYSIYELSKTSIPSGSYATKARRAEKEELKPVPGAEIADSILDAYSDDASAMVSARLAASFTSTLGIVLMLIGLFGIPVAVLWVYRQPAAFPAEVSTALLDTARSHPDQTVEIARLYRRDWHVLLTIGSIGFLLLAIGAGFLRESRHKMNIYFRLARRVQVMRAYHLAIQVSRRLDAQTVKHDGFLGKTAAGVIDQLLTTSHDRHEDLVEGTDPSVEAIKAAAGKLSKSTG